MRIVNSFIESETLVYAISQQRFDAVSPAIKPEISVIRRPWRISVDHGPAMLGRINRTALITRNGRRNGHACEISEVYLFADAWILAGCAIALIKSAIRCALVSSLNIAGTIRKTTRSRNSTGTDSCGVYHGSFSGMLGNGDIAAGDFLDRLNVFAE